MQQFRKLSAWLDGRAGWKRGAITGVTTVAACFALDLALNGMHRALVALPGRAVVMIPIITGLYAWLRPKSFLNRQSSLPKPVADDVSSDR